MLPLNKTRLYILTPSHRHRPIILALGQYTSMYPTWPIKPCLYMSLRLFRRIWTGHRKNRGGGGSCLGHGSGPCSSAHSIMVCPTSRRVQCRHFQFRVARAVFLARLLGSHGRREFRLESQFLAVQVENDGNRYQAECKTSQQSAGPFNPHPIEHLSRKQWEPCCSNRSEKCVGCNGGSGAADNDQSLALDK